MNTLELYFYLTLPEVRTTLLTIFSLACVVLVILSVSFALSETRPKRHNEETEQFDNSILALKRKRKVSFRLLFVGVAMLLAASWIPPKETMYALIAWELGQSVDGLAQLPAEVIEYFRAFLAQYSGELARIPADLATKAADSAGQVMEASTAVEGAAGAVIETSEAVSQAAEQVTEAAEALGEVIDKALPAQSR